jgi:hypothetical protein
VWGTTRHLPPSCLAIEVLAPGLLVVKHRVRKDSAKFHNLAVLESDQVKVLAAPSAEAAELGPLVQTILDPALSDSTAQADDVLLRLAESMRAHRRGGILLIVPAGTEAWRQSILEPVPYAVAPPFRQLAELVEEAAASADFAGHDELGRAIEAVAGLTAVDGATVITDRFELLAFGAKVARSRGEPRVEEVVVSEPVEGREPVRMALNHVGGTRHLAGAQFAQDQRDAVALVASQDGGFTLFAWSARWRQVRAHRLEVLLL